MIPSPCACTSCGTAAQEASSARSIGHRHWTHRTRPGSGSGASARSRRPCSAVCWRRPRVAIGARMVGGSPGQSACGFCHFQIGRCWFLTKITKLLGNDRRDPQAQAHPLRRPGRDRHTRGRILKDRRTAGDVRASIHDRGQSCVLPRCPPRPARAPGRDPGAGGHHQLGRADGGLRAGRPRRGRDQGRGAGRRDDPPPADQGARHRALVPQPGGQPQQTVAVARPPQAGRPRPVPRAGGPQRRRGRELPGRCARRLGPRLRGLQGRQARHHLRVDLRLRPVRPRVAPGRLRPHRPGHLRAGWRSTASPTARPPRAPPTSATTWPDCTAPSAPSPRCATATRPARASTSTPRCSTRSCSSPTAT